MGSRPRRPGTGHLRLRRRRYIVSATARAQDVERRLARRRWDLRRPRTAPVRRRPPDGWLTARPAGHQLRLRLRTSQLPPIRRQLPAQLAEASASSLSGGIPRCDDGRRARLAPARDRSRRPLPAAAPGTVLQGPPRRRAQPTAASGSCADPRPRAPRCRRVRVTRPPGAVPPDYRAKHKAPRILRQSPDEHATGRARLTLRAPRPPPWSASKRSPTPQLQHRHNPAPTHITAARRRTKPASARPRS